MSLEKLNQKPARAYKVSEAGTSYHPETPEQVIQVLEEARKNRTRVKLYYGDRATGRDWLEEYDTTGTIGRSTGRNQVPLLIKTARSIGGGAVLAQCILKIKDTKTGRILYQAENYQEPVIEKVHMQGQTGSIHQLKVIVNGVDMAFCINEASANRYINRIK